MAIPQEIGRLSLGDMTALWYEYVNHVTMFSLVPTSKLPDMAQRREYLSITDAAHRGNAFLRKSEHGGNAIFVEGCLQAKYERAAGLSTQSASFSAGVSMRGDLFQLKKLEYGADGRSATLIFNDVDNLGLEARQCFAYQPGDRWITVSTTITNHGDKPQKLEYLASFSLGLLSPFQREAGADAYTLLQWHSAWAGEGRLEERHVEDVGMEQAWNSYGIRTVRFGSANSMPVTGYFPQIGFADNEAGVVWGASLETFGPWQMQFSRTGDCFNIDGGLPDREFNDWWKELAPGESLTGLNAAITCAAIPEYSTAAETLCNRLAPFAGCPKENTNSTEARVPALFNDWCKTWGAPYPANLRPVLERLKTRNVAYLNMDYGWFQCGTFGADVNAKHPDIGDWLPYDPGEQYPNGFDAWLQEIRDAGVIPGVWFEFENAVKCSLILRDHPDWFLTLDGKLLNDGLRHFLDFRKPEVVAYAKERVIDFLRDHKIGYMKVDYNAPIGNRCDGPNASKSENLREAVQANVEFFRMLRRELPELTLEICASGGFRCSAGWQRLAAIASSSDAHEGVEIPLLAANTAMLIATRNNQIWATVHEWDDENRLLYLLAGGCIGRLCLSGDLEKLAPWQMEIVDKGLAYYSALKDIIIAGDNSIQRRLKSRSYITPKGEQLFTRTAATGEKLSAILHTFGDTDADTQWLIHGDWRISGTTMAPAGAVIKAVRNGNGSTTLIFQGMPDFSATAAILERV